MRSRLANISFFLCNRLIFQTSIAQTKRTIDRIDSRADSLIGLRSFAINSRAFDYEGFKRITGSSEQARIRVATVDLCLRAHRQKNLERCQVRSSICLCFFNEIRGCTARHVRKDPSWYRSVVSIVSIDSVTCNVTWSIPLLNVTICDKNHD